MWKPFGIASPPQMCRQGGDFIFYKILLRYTCLCWRSQRKIPVPAMNFWQHLTKPILALAPMADVTDPAFRRLIAKYGKPDVFWTEFVSADGLFLGGYDALIKDPAF